MVLHQWESVTGYLVLSKCKLASIKSFKADVSSDQGLASALKLFMLANLHFYNTKYPVTLSHFAKHFASILHSSWPIYVINLIDNILNYLIFKEINISIMEH